MSDGYEVACAPLRTLALIPWRDDQWLFRTNRFHEDCGHGKRLINQLDLTHKESDHDHSQQAYREAHWNRSPDRPGRRPAETASSGGAAGSSGSGDDPSAGSRRRRADGHPARVSRRLLQPGAGDADRQAGITGAAGPGGTVLDRAVRPGSALGESAGERTGRDVCAGRVDAQGQGDHRGAVRTYLFGQYGQPYQRQPGPAATPLCRAEARRGVSVSGAGRTLRKGAP